MGNSCNGQNQILQVFFGIQKISQLKIQKPSEKQFIKKNYQSNRFHGQIQKLRSNNTNMKYKLILPVDSSTLQIRTIEVDFLFSHSDLQLYSYYQFQIIDKKLAPIIDHFEQQPQQIYHKIQIQGKVKTMKYYNFSNIQDYTFKAALYQIQISLDLPNSHLQNYFIIHRSQQKQLVMLFQYFSASLHDIILFRKATNFYWSQKQILTISKMIINSYKKMAQKGIVHRDIRPSNIFFCRSLSNNKQLNVYQIGNLYSARYFENDSNSQQLQMLTLKGVPAFVNNPIKDILLSDQQIYGYDPLKLDLQAIQLTLYCIINLTICTKQKDLSKASGKVKQLMECFKHPINIQQLDRKVQNLSKSVSIFGEQLLERDRNICQNIQKKLYFNQKSSNEMINQIYLKSLFDLHKKDIFVPYMMEQINKNYQSKQKRQNIDLFLKLGQYFSKNGINDNQYYRQAIKIILQISSSQRICGFYTEHSQTLKQAEQVFQKLEVQNQDNKSIKAIFLKQKAYEIYYDSNVLDRQSKSLQQINEALSICSKLKNLAIQDQLDVLFAKGELQLNINGCQTAEPFFQQGLSISSQNKNFKSKAIYNFYRGLFQYGTAMAKIKNIKMDRNEAKAKTISKIQQLLKKAKQRFESVQIPVIYIIWCFIANSDLCYLRQDYQSSKKMSQRALILLKSQNKQFSTQIQMQIIDRLIVILDKQDKYKAQYEKYVKQKNELSKNLETSSRNKKKSRNKGKRQKQITKQKRQNGLDIIRQEQQFKQMKESNRY